MTKLLLEGQRRHTSRVPRLTLRSGDVTAVVDTRRGARLASLQFAGTEILVTSGVDPFSWGCYPMVPFAGRVRDARLAANGDIHQLDANAGRHAIHGTVFDTAWEVESRDERSATCVTDLGSGWPFAGLVVQRIDVDDHGVTLRIAVHADQDQPVQVGWHPWFIKPSRLDHGCQMMHIRDRDGIATADVIPVLDGPWDDCFVAGHDDPTLTVRQVDLRLTSDCSHWVVYDIPSHATCVEPQSGPPNAVNDDPTLVSAGSMFARWFRISRDGVS